MGLKDLYLIAYNSACCVGWAMVWCMALYSLATASISSLQDVPTALSNVYFFDSLELMLIISQTAALLEVVHALVGLVRSPVTVTFLQVASRIVALVAVVYSPAAQSQWGAGLMILSWASVEVPRYAFYLAALVTGDSIKKTPYALFWLRYSLFAILYPTGIVGELTVFLHAADDPVFTDRWGGPWATWYYARLLPVVYFFGSPFMIYNMVLNRKKAFRKRFAKAPPPPRGLVWPITDPTTGARSSTPTNQAILAAASKDPSAVTQARGWRFHYVHYFRALVEYQCTSPAVCVASAHAGLAKAYELFQFVSPDGTSTASLATTMAEATTESFATGRVEGTAATPAATALQVPYQGQVLTGAALKAQVQKWVEYGTIEPSAGHAICQCVDHPEWIQHKLKDRYFVLLGAGSAMGPFHVLMALGANVVAIDLDRPRIWERLIGIARASAGTLTFPLSKAQADCGDDADLCASAGCNLFTHTPMIRNWLLQLYPGKPFTVGSYAYLDGALHVQVSLAMDAITRDLSEKRKNTSLAYLCTPTDLHLIPKEAHDAQVAHYRDYCQRFVCRLLRWASPQTMLRPNPQDPIPGDGDGELYYLVNGMSVAQGPNYALAKRLQHWRAIIAHHEHGCVVSSNIAPSTSTVSVVHNRTFAWAYEGLPYFTPMEIFAPDTSNAVMTALLLYDIHDPQSVAAAGGKTLANPNQLFSSGAFHGGVWRCAFEMDSMGVPAVLLYFGRCAQPYVGAAVALVVAAVAYSVASSS